DVRAVAHKLVEQAKAGDAAAAKLLLAYVVGRPAAPVNPDTLDMEEWNARREMPDFAAVLSAVGVTTFEDALRMIENLQSKIVRLPLEVSNGASDGGNGDARS